MAKKRKRKMTRAAAKCLTHEIAKHCRKGKRNKCRKAKARKQAVAIGFAVCKRRGFKLPPKP